MSESVAIVGGGIAGMCASHHLARAGVSKITVYEAEDELGGKARSQHVPVASGATYPGEHGFRFFPHFYRHLLQTLRQIPVGHGKTVYDRLRGPKTAAIAYGGRKLLEVPRPVTIRPSLSFVDTTIDVLMRQEVKIEDATRFAWKLLMFASSCDERRESQYDLMSWTEYTGADDGLYSPEFEDVAIRASQNLSAMKASQSSAATIGTITLQLMFFFSGEEKPDAILAGPTDEMWLNDWRAYLEKLGVRFETGRRLTAFEFDALGGRITSLRFGADQVTADHYIAAIPLEKLVELVDAPMMAFDPALAALPALQRRAQGDMTGMQFFLSRPLPITRGHVHYPGTPFALTSVSQGQFWARPPQERPGTPELREVISVIVSDWDEPGTEGIPARNYTEAKDLAAEVWRQMKSALPSGTLRDEDVITFHLDTNISLNPFRNSTPLLIHPRDQRRHRPDAETAIQNLFLAADFVRTYTDLATMEGAEEAARRAARAILFRMGIDKARWPAVMPLDEGYTFEIGKRIDAWRYRFQADHPLLTPRWALGSLVATVRRAVGFADDAKVSSLAQAISRLPEPARAATDLETLRQWEWVLRDDNER